MNPKISIIIPAYNSSATIVEALESVLVQSFWAKKTLDLRPQTIDLCEAQGSNVNGLKSNIFPLYEVIVVDDCSRDDTVKVAEEWIKGKTIDHRPKPALHSLGDAGTIDLSEAQKSNVSGTPSVALAKEGLWSIVSLPVNGGPAVARNKGIEEAHGEWIAFLDADDIWLPHKLELQMRFASEHPEVALWCGNCIGFTDAETLDPRPKTLDQSEAQKSNVHGLGSKVPFPVLSPVTLETLALRNPIATSTVLVKREALLAVGGFDPQFRGPEDYDLWLRVAGYATQIPGHRLQAIDLSEAPVVTAVSAVVSRGKEGAAGTSLRHPPTPRLRRAGGYVGQAAATTEEHSPKSNVYGTPSIMSSVASAKEEALAKEGLGSIVSCATPVSRYRQVPGSLSLNDVTFLPQVLRVLKKAYGMDGVFHGQRGYGKAVAYQYLCAAWSAAERGDVSRATVNLLQSLRHSPGSLSRVTHLSWERTKIVYCIFRAGLRKIKL